MSRIHSRTAMRFPQGHGGAMEGFCFGWIQRSNRGANPGISANVYSNAFRGYPRIRKIPGAFNNKSQDPWFAGDSYEIVFCETNEPLGQKAVVPLSRAPDILFVSLALPRDMIGLVHLADGGKIQRKISAYQDALAERNIVFLEQGKIVG